jgi:predicted DsbA family dithiol-disulfide isomerase
MTQRFGAEKYDGIRAHLSQMGGPEGINFSFNSKTGNTHDSHRLVQLAKTKNPRDADGNVQDTETENRVVKEIMRSYFELDGDITSRDMLVDAAARAGLDRDEAKQWLESENGDVEVDREVFEAYKMGIRGVPHFVINGKYHVNGAREVPEFLEQFSKAKAESA